MTFTRTLISGAPIPNNITFPSVSSKGMDISWDCDLSRMNEEDKRKVTYVVEVKKGTDEDRGWREVYSGAENKSSASGLDKDSEYNVRVKCVIGGLQGGWSDVVSVRTKKIEFETSEWKRCPDNVSSNRKYTVDENNPGIARFLGSDWCTIIGSTPLPPNKVTSWNIKILQSRDNDGTNIRVGIVPPNVNQNTDNQTKCGWYVNCYTSSLCSGPPHNYINKEYGPRNGSGKYVNTGGNVGVVMDTAKGELSFVLGGVNFGVAYEGIPLDKPLVPCVIVKCKGDSVELVI